MTLSTNNMTAEYWRVPGPIDVDSFTTHHAHTHTQAAFKKRLKLIHQFSGKSKDFNFADVWCLFICTIEIDDLS